VSVSWRSEAVLGMLHGTARAQESLVQERH